VGRSKGAQENWDRLMQGTSDWEKGGDHSNQWYGIQKGGA